MIVLTYSFQVLTLFKFLATHCSHSTEHKVMRFFTGLKIFFPYLGDMKVVFEIPKFGFLAAFLIIIPDLVNR